MTIWSGEIKELDKLCESFKGHLPFIMKEIDQLIKTEDPNVVMLYSRRCLEVIITDLCEIELGRPRKTEPLKGIIDKLNSEEKVPSHIINSMLSLNSMASYGAHPKDFDPEQVKPVLNNLAIIIRWYIKYKNLATTGLSDENKIIIPENDREHFPTPKKHKSVLILGLLILIILLLYGVLKLVKVSGSENENSYEKLNKTIAVLPFTKLGNDTTQTFFTEGFIEEILNNLQRINEFTIRSRADQYKNTTKDFKTIGKEMDVQYLIKGVIDIEENTLRVWIKLVDVKKDELIWSNDYTREMKQLFSLQSEIAKEIASELKTVLSPEEIQQIDKKPTENLEAYSYFLAGNNYSLSSYNVQDFEAAVKMYEKAIESDPNFEMAYVNLGLCHLRLFWLYSDHTSGRLAMAKEAIDKAFKIDPDLPEAHLALSSYYYMGFLNYPKALEEVQIAEKFSGNSTLYFSNKANIYRRSGDWSLGKENYIKALELDPGSPIKVYDLALTDYFLGDYEQSEKYFNKTLILKPDFKEAIWQESLMYLKWNGNTIKSREVIMKAFKIMECSYDPVLIQCNVEFDIYDRNYEKALAYLNSKDIDIIEHHLFFNLKSLLCADIYSLMNMPEKAHQYYDSARISLESKILLNSDDSRLYSALGIAYAGLGKKEKAVEAGEKAVELMPIKKDALRGVYRNEDLARIYVMVGEYDDAIKLINQLLKIPSRLSPKLLKLDPVWKPLWNLPEFEKLIPTGS